MAILTGLYHPSPTLAPRIPLQRSPKAVAVGGYYGVAFLPFLILQRELLALKWILCPLEAGVCALGRGPGVGGKDGILRANSSSSTLFLSKLVVLESLAFDGTCPLSPTILLPRFLSLVGTFLTLTPVVPGLPSQQTTQGCWLAGGSGSIWRLHTPGTPRCASSGECLHDLYHL